MSRVEDITKILTKRTLPSAVNRTLCTTQPSIQQTLRKVQDELSVFSNKLLFMEQCLKFQLGTTKTNY